MNQIRQLRQEAGLSRAYIAAHCEVGEAQVRRWESGEVLVPTRHLLDLTAIFGVSVEQLMGWQERAEA